MRSGELMETFEKPLPVPSTYSNLAIKLANEIGLKTKQYMKQRETKKRVIFGVW